MPLIDTNHQRAALLVLLLGLALVIALTPYATGLIGSPVLYAVFSPVHEWLSLRARPKVHPAPRVPGSVVRSPLIGRIAQLELGGVDIGPRIAELGAKIVGWLGSSAFGLVGTATRLALNLTISLFGLFYLLLRPGETWEAVRPYIPFSAKNTEKLRQRFRDVTTSTIIGTGLTAAAQGAILGLAFWIVGLPNALFWGVVTMVFGILPIVGSGLVWVPAAIALLIGNRPGPAALITLVGLFVGNVDYILRPMVFRRWANIHPLVTLVGALAGVPYFGILGLLIGPLALSYFFELVKMYREEYLST